METLAGEVLYNSGRRNGNAIAATLTVKMVTTPASTPSESSVKNEVESTDQIRMIRTIADAVIIAGRFQKRKLMATSKEKMGLFAAMLAIKLLYGSTGSVYPVAVLVRKLILAMNCSPALRYSSRTPTIIKSESHTRAPSIIDNCRFFAHDFFHHDLCGLTDLTAKILMEVFLRWHT